MRRIPVSSGCRDRRRIAASAWLVCLAALGAASAGADEALDARVRAFLDEHAGDWHDLNVPAADGKILHDIVVEHGFTRAVEIGTSTGHSTIWIAWALAKTGGRLTTIEIDERRYEQARANIAEAGLAEHVELVLGDAHEVVPQLEGPYDFVFSDADKDWYVNYFDALYPKLTGDACFTAHNVRDTGGWRGEYLEHVRSIEDMTTRLHPQARAGIAVTCKR